MLSLRKNYLLYALSLTFIFNSVASEQKKSNTESTETNDTKIDASSQIGRASCRERV